MEGWRKKKEKKSRNGCEEPEEEEQGDGRCVQKRKRKWRERNHEKPIVEAQVAEENNDHQQDKVKHHHFQGKENHHHLLDKEGRLLNNGERALDAWTEEESHLT